MNTDKSHGVELPESLRQGHKPTLIKPPNLRLPSRMDATEPWSSRPDQTPAYPCLPVFICGSNFLAFAPQAFSPTKLL